MFLAAAALAGAGLSLYGAISGANAQADAAGKDAALKNAQADELLQRQAINEAIIRDQAQKAGLGFGASFSATGREGGGIGGILQINKNAQDEIMNTRRDAEFKANMLRSGANIETDLASSGVTAAWISGVGGLLSTGAATYNAMSPPSSKAPSLPGVS